MSAALNGRTADAARLAERGRETYPHIDALMRFMLTLGEVRALTLAGDFDTAQSRSGDIVRITSPSQFRARAMAQVLAATVEVGRGRLRAAMERLEENLAALSGETSAAWILPARLLLAQCYCGLGMDEAAAPLVAELGDRVGSGGQSFAPSVRIAEAWLAAAEGNAAWRSQRRSTLPTSPPKAASAPSNSWPCMPRPASGTGRPSRAWSRSPGRWADHSPPPTPPTPPAC